MGIENIQTLDQLNDALKLANKTPEASIITSSWGSRNFLLLDPNNKSENTSVKLNEIIALFETLVKKNPDNKSLIFEIHDRICELDLEGDKKLSKKGRHAIFLRDIRNIRNIFGRTHIKRLDKIENHVLFLNGKEQTEYGKDVDKAKQLIERCLAKYTVHYEHWKYASEFEKVLDEWQKSTEKRITIQNALHVIVQKDPEIARKIMDLLRNRSFLLQTDETLQSFREFRDLMEVNIAARTTDRDKFIKGDLTILIKNREMSK